MLKTLAVIALTGVSVVDGDTFCVRGTCYDVLGYYIPKMNGQCTSERQLAQVARSTLHRILTEDDSTVAYEVPCSSGKCAKVFVHKSQNIAPFMVAEGLASSRPTNWCASEVPTREMKSDRLDQSNRARRVGLVDEDHE
jgi:endonuclease YncB( thermonuclease family)